MFMRLENNNVLKEYYARYLTDIRGLSNSSVRHYYDALNNISRRLKTLGLVQESIYEITDLARLKEIREILLSDRDFSELDRRGNNMYSAGLNNYIRFASGDVFSELSDKKTAFDTPVNREQPASIRQTVWPRSTILRTQALAMADFKCEMNPLHESFIAEKTHKQYMEGHHAIPMRLQPSFEHSLDVYANIICLCPVCHRRIHHGLISDRTDMMNKVYEDRSERLINCGINLSKQEFVSLVI